jgi:hypothetical protein
MSTDNNWRPDMVIENRELFPRTKLVGQYRKRLHYCEVVENGKGVCYRLEDGRTFTSLSSAAKAVMGGVSANGWRFWSIALAVPVSAPISEPIAVTSRKIVRQLTKLPNQKGVPEGEVRWFCSACQRSFSIDGKDAPAACPKGHLLDPGDEFLTA